MRTRSSWTFFECPVLRGAEFPCSGSPSQSARCWIKTSGPLPPRTPYISLPGVCGWRPPQLLPADGVSSVARTSCYPASPQLLFPTLAAGARRGSLNQPWWAYRHCRHQQTLQSGVYACVFAQRAGRHTSASTPLSRTRPREAPADE